MKASKFLLSLLPLAGCGLASSQQREEGQQTWPSTGVDPAALLITLIELTLMSRNMRPELLQVNRHTAAEDLIGDMLTETYILYTYAQRLEDTPPFNPEMESVVLGVGFVQWKKDTNDFLVRLGQFSNDFRKNSTDSTRIIRTYLIAFKKAANYFCRNFHAVTPDLEIRIPWLELHISGEESDLPATFEHTIRRFTNKTPQGR